VKERFGRLTKAPHPELHRLIYGPSFQRDIRDVLPWLLKINAAHVVMLENCGILESSTAAALLRANDDFTTAFARGVQPLPTPESHRGLYAVFENELIDQLGTEVGGAVHMARSRNDINATVTRLRVRQNILSVVDHLLALQASMLARASALTTMVMPGFTHFQPAQPTTLGHYLAAVATELDRALDRLFSIDDRMDRCPMGACAGFGTSFAIRPDIVAALLGFAAPATNSLDAVASRDFIVDFLAWLATLGTTLTRLALDLQLWSSNAYGFIGWADDLVSTSSIMPQKRNAFVLETVRGKAATAAGELIAAITGLKNTPFTNSVEVSADVGSRGESAAADTGTALQLLRLLIDQMIFDEGAAAELATDGGITATALADMIVRETGLSFRLAHDAVGEIAAAIMDHATPEEVTAELELCLRAHTGKEVSLEVETIRAVLEPQAVLQQMSFGGGPAPETVEQQIDALRKSLSRHGLRASARRAAQDAASERLRAEVKRIRREGDRNGRRRKRA
jgi:argininosuccinate lyase